MAVPDSHLHANEWLRPITTMQDDFYNLRRQRVTDTANWIFEDETFSAWNNGRDCDGGPTLLVQGPPGSGKSVLASSVIEALSRDESSICVYSFCRHDDERQRDLAGILRTAISD